MMPKETEPALPASSSLDSKAMATQPTSATPMTMLAIATQWCRYYFFLRKMIERMGVTTLMNPRIIWYTEAGTIVRAMNMRVEPAKSHEAGIARRKGLGFIFSIFCSACCVPGESNCLAFSGLAAI